MTPAQVVAEFGGDKGEVERELIERMDELTAEKIDNCLRTVCIHQGITPAQLRKVPDDVLVVIIRATGLQVDADGARKCVDGWTP